MKHLYFLLFLSFISVVSYSQYNTDSQHVFTLGEVVVRTNVNRNINNTVSANKISVLEKNDVAKALNILPGVNISAVGPRNESMVYVRGFDLRQVPLLIDGIPVYVPYDGYVDLARFTTFDFAEVNVSKGYTSVIYGPNALGGAINLISKRPVKPLEFDGATGWLSGGYRTNVNIGSNFGKFYIQAGASKIQRDSFPLPGNFKSTKTEEGGWRNNSYNSDEKFNVKVAYTPGKNSEYALSYIYQNGKKGTPVYSGNDTLNSQYKAPRYWQWPYWDKQSLYFISNTTIDTTQYIKTRLYYDKFKNLLISYDDATYSTISRPYAFKSYYNDYTFGGIVEYGKRFSNVENIIATVQHKQDVHREHNEGEPVRKIEDGTFTAGIENQLKLTPELLLLTGFSYNNRSSINAQGYNNITKAVTEFPSNNNNAFNVQGGLVYSLNASNSLNFSFARKTRFATVKDRYSYRLGTAIPNPELKAETAGNYNMSYGGTVNSKLRIQASLFYSKIKNTILMVSNVMFDAATNRYLSQLQNVGKSEYLGGEIGVEYAVISALQIGANYTYIKRNNLTNPSIYFTDVPGNKVFAYLQYGALAKVYAQINTEYNSTRYSTSYGTVSGAFTLLNATAGVHIWKWFSVEAGINNITDKNFTLAEGYPEPGRNYSANLIYRL